MSLLNLVIDRVVQVLWGTHTFGLLLALGLLFSVWTKFVQWRSLTHGIALVRGKYDERHDPGAINHFQALSTALSGTVGLGNIAGVALAISLGGPGALFWMWVTGIFGMAIKAVEVTLAMMYRDTSDPDNPRGGTMWIARNGLAPERRGPRDTIARIIAAIFCLALLLTIITSGNMFQSWNVANITRAYFGVPQVLTGTVMAVLTGLVIIGGIRRIGDVTGILVPMMCGLYLLAGISVLVLEAANIPALLAGIVRDAFSPTEAQGAFLGASLWFGITTGLRRALFSNEAGQGTSPIAHSAAKTSEPVREGIVAGLEPFIDTCLVCTLTALVILGTETWNRGPIGEFSGTPGIHSEVAHFEPNSPDEVLEPNQHVFMIAALADGQRVKIRGSIEKLLHPGEELVIRWETVMPNGAAMVDHSLYRDYTGAALTGHAFDRAVPGLGKWLVTLTCWLFAISTMISWSYYGEQATVYLLGTRAVVAYKLLFCVLGVVATLPGFITTDAHLGNLADLGAGLMLFVNAPVVLFMSPRAIAAMRDYFRRLDSGAMQPTRALPPMLDVIEGRDVE
ncbi:MAG TPA: amino acid carrier protein [Pirellulales bacterium]|nr:amino acid carrier protein [Pirellulales bacterium]